MNKALKRKGKKSFDDAYPLAKFGFRSLLFGRSKKKVVAGANEINNTYKKVISKSYL